MNASTENPCDFLSTPADRLVARQPAETELDLKSASELRSRLLTMILDNEQRRKVRVPIAPRPR